MSTDPAFADTDRLRRGSRYWILLAATLCLIGSAAVDPTWAQQQGRQSYFSIDDLYKYCPPERRIEFVIGSTPVYVDFRQLVGSPALAEPSTEINGCPNALVAVQYLFLAMPKEIGLRNGVRVDRLTLAIPHRAAMPSEAGSEAIAAWVEDQTAVNHVSVPQARSYRLHYPKIDESSDLTADIWCSSISRYRSCDVKPYVYRRLLVRYSVTLPNFLVPSGDQPPSLPMNESRVLLEFDDQLREWINTIERKP